MARDRALARGLTVIELLVVVAIVVAMVALAVPAGQNRDSVASEARRLLTDAVRTRSVARTRWEPAQLTVDVAGRRWRCATLAGEPILGPDSDADGWRTLSDGVRFERVAGSETTYVFLPNGRTQGEAAVGLRLGSAAWVVGCGALSGQIYSYPLEEP